MLNDVNPCNDLRLQPFSCQGLNTRMYTYATLGPPEVSVSISDTLDVHRGVGTLYELLLSWNAQSYELDQRKTTMLRSFVRSKMMDCVHTG